ncbi:putative reverse transcriptase domain-containing protein [Tanacetum coccineum]
MSDSEDSTVTYTEVSSLFEDLSDIRSPGVDGLPMMPEDPYLAYPEFMPPEDNMLPAEEQPLPAAVSPTADSPGYITEFDSEETPIPFPPVAEVDIFLAISTPPSSPLTSYSSPLPQIPSPPLPVSPPALPASPTHPLGYRAAMIQLRAEPPSTSHPLPIILPHTRESMAMMRVAAPSTYILASRSETPPSGTPPLLPIPLPTPSPPLLLPSTDCRAGVSEVTLPARKRLCIALGPRFKVGESSSDPTARPTGDLRRDYGFAATLDDEIRRFLERDDTDEIYGRLDDAHDDRLLMSSQLNLLRRDRRAHARFARLMEVEARASSTTTTTTTPVTDAQLKALIDQGVADALAARDAYRSQNGKDRHDSGTGGTEGVVELTQWFERMKTVFRISNCTMENQIKFATCTLLGSVLTWWNSHVRTVGHDVAYAMTWTNLKNMMTDKYCPRGEIKKLEVEMWNLKEVLEESDKIERYVGGLPDMIHGSVMESKPKTMQDAIKFATELMDKKIRTFAERQSENKRKQDDNQKQQNKRQNTGRAYTAGSGEKKPYGWSKPLCSKCNYHHDGQCAPKCHKCNRVCHLARDYRSTANVNTANNQRGTGAGQKPTCFECGSQGHFKRECPKLKSNNRGNQVRNGNAPSKVYAVGRIGTNPDSNVVRGTFLLNNRYASILFDTDSNKSFVSTAFSS